MSKPGPTTVPANTLTGVPKLNRVSLSVNPLHYYVMSTQFNNVGSSVFVPSPVITANRKWHYIVNAQFNNIGHSIQDPAPTLIAQMGKKPNSVVTAVHGGKGVPLSQDDYPEVLLIKEFMAKWGIKDIFMRELRIPEMLLIHTMPADLPMIGSITDKKKFIGNQVPAEIVTKLLLGSYYGNLKERMKAA